MTNFMFISGMVAKLSPTDYVGFTFFVGCMAMMAALHFSLSLSQFDKNGVLQCLVSGLITFIAAAHFYMRDYWASFGESPIPL
jgi:hypothetical protein